MRKNLSLAVLAICLTACSPSDTAKSDSAYVSSAAPTSTSTPAAAVSWAEREPAMATWAEWWAAQSRAPAQAEPLPSEAELVKWQAEMDTFCTSAAPSLRIAHFDIDGNDTADTICWRILKTKDYGELIDVQARVTNAGKAQTAYIILPFDRGYQYGICGPSDAIVAEQERWTKKDFEERGWDYIGPVSISLTGGDCDTPRLFWPTGESGEVVEFIFARL